MRSNRVNVTPVLHTDIRLSTKNDPSSSNAGDSHIKKKGLSKESQALTATSTISGDGTNRNALGFRGLGQGRRGRRADIASIVKSNDALPEHSTKDQGKTQQIIGVDTTDSTTADNEEENGHSVQVRGLNMRLRNRKEQQDTPVDNDANSNSNPSQAAPHVDTDLDKLLTRTHAMKDSHVTFTRDIFDLQGKVKSISYNPVFNMMVADVSYPNGLLQSIPAVDGMQIGSVVKASRHHPVDIRPGNATQLVNIPIGEYVSCVELRVGHGANIATTPGSYGQVVAKEHSIHANYAIIRLHNGDIQIFHLNCLATIGRLSQPVYAVKIKPQLVSSVRTPTSLVTPAKRRRKPTSTNTHDSAAVKSYLRTVTATQPEKHPNAVQTPLRTIYTGSTTHHTMGTKRRVVQRHIPMTLTPMLRTSG